MSVTAGVVLLVAAMAVITGVALQVSQYLRGRQLITRGQFVLRMVTAGILLFIIAMIFGGVLFQWPSPEAELGFWAVLTLLAIAVIFLAFSDLRQVEQQQHLKQAELYRSVAQPPDPKRKKDES
jgi:TRAP-type C4-dicarboxylate transport system permease large subunit